MFESKYNRLLTIILIRNVKTFENLAALALVMLTAGRHGKPSGHLIPVVVRPCVSAGMEAPYVKVQLQIYKLRDLKTRHDKVLK